ncbi:hypothetical protein [uncultured Roseobacter sp.]|uniref:hypothetical protein n=1 Tax=uncultured Roseobacter sp. TaxID=114847 RepID=UPI0026254484|nr:hypothetical protein [uncultured Roseobacter sp.]
MNTDPDPENIQWVIEVIDELREFAQANNLPEFDRKLIRLAQTARLESNGQLPVPGAARQGVSKLAG